MARTKILRFTKASVETALSDLRERIQAANDDPTAPYRVVEAVVFGDILSDQQRLQGAEVGIQLEPRRSGLRASDANDFIRQLRGKNATRLHLQRYERWMNARVHLKLV